MNVVKIYLLIIFAASTVSAACQDALSHTGLAADAELYRETISSKHKNPFTKIRQEDFEAQINALIERVPAIDEDQFIVELLKINASIGDEHTILFPDFKFELPFKFENFDEGMAIIAADSLNSQYLLHRVVSINRKSMSEITTGYTTLIKQDNPSYFKFFMTYYFVYPQILKGLGLIRDVSVIEFQLLSPSGDTVTATIDSHRTTEKTKWHYAPQYHNLLAYAQNSNYWYRFDEKNSILYFNYQHCSETDGEPFKAFNKKLFQTIAALKPAKLILDLRFNGGGNSAILEPFIKSIKTSELNSKDHFFVLIGRQVMSSSMMNAIELKQTTNATFVGEPTGGNINHFGEIKSFTLPNTNTRITYSTKYWENWKDHSGALQPDIEVSNSIFDFMKSIDPVLEIINAK